MCLVIAQEGSNDTVEPGRAKRVDPPAGAPTPQFPGYAEMGFSTPENRFFYEQNSYIKAGSGGFGDVKKCVPCPSPSPLPRSCLVTMQMLDHLPGLSGFIVAVGGYVAP